MVEARQDEKGGVRDVELRKFDYLCPFRGYPHRYPLDQRCPSTILVLYASVEEITGDIAGKAPRQRALVTVSTPIVRDGSSCQACLDGHVREREAGMDSPRGGTPSRGGSALRRRR